MLRINRTDKCLTTLDQTSLGEAKIQERTDLQEYIFNSPNEFWTELGEKLFIVGKEVSPSTVVSDRIDLLALDKEGNGVIVELKRGSNKFQLLQSLSYAGMLSKWSSEHFLDLLDEKKTEELIEFLDDELEYINRKQRVILVAEDFDYSVLVTAEWLSEQYGVDIACCRISLVNDEETQSEYLVCSNVFPNPELSKEAAARGSGKVSSAKGSNWKSWDDAISSTHNSFVKEFFEQQLTSKREGKPQDGVLHFRLDGKRRFMMRLRKKNAYCSQRQRFPDDIEIWRTGLSNPASVVAIFNGSRIRMSLHTKEDFDFFMKQFTTELVDIDWLKNLSEKEEEEDLGEDE